MFGVRLILFVACVFASALYGENQVRKQLCKTDFAIHSQELWVWCTINMDAPWYDSSLTGEFQNDEKGWPIKETSVL